VTAPTPESIPASTGRFERLPGGRLTQAAGASSIVVDPSDGGRLTSLRVEGTEVLGATSPAPGLPSGIFAGSFLMAPFVGRADRGRFDFGNESWTLPTNAGPHALHGFVFDRAWRVDGDELVIDLDDRWPFGGTVRQRFDLGPDSLTVTATISNEERSMPAVLGFHPWFTERLADGSPGSFDFDPGTRFVCDSTGVPVGTVAGGGERPWDDSFADVRTPPVVRWTDGPQVRIGTTGSHWIVCETMPGAFCVEPLTGPVNALAAGGAAVVGPGRPLTLVMTLSWRDS